MAFEFRWVLFLGLLAAALAFTVVGAALGTLYIVKLLFGIIAIILDLLAMSTRYFTYLFNPLLKMKGRKLVLDSGEPYVMSPSGNAITRREGNLIYATAFVKIPVYRSGTEMTDQEKSDFAATFGKMLSIINEPFRLSTQLYVLNKDEYIDKIRRKLNESQDKYNQMLSKEGLAGQIMQKNTAPEAERIRGEVTMWRNMLDSVTKAKAHSMASYAQVTAVAESEEEAVNLAVSKADDLAAGISSTFGIGATLAGGLEILQFIEPEQMIPVANLSAQISLRSDIK